MILSSLDRGAIALGALGAVVYAGRRPVGPLWSGGPHRRGTNRPNRPDAAHWARTSDLRRLSVRPGRPVLPRVDREPPLGRLVLGHFGRRLLAAERAQSVIVFGPTQSHKTSGFAIPAVLGWQGPVVAVSVKRDLLDHTIAHRRSLGDVKCFDPSSSTGIPSAPWSPLESARTWPGARRVASGMTEVVKTNGGTMSDGEFWYQTATRMLAPLLFAASVGRLGIEDVVRWVALQEEDEVLDLLRRAGVDEALDAARSMFGKEERQRSSIYTTVETVLEPFDRAGTAERPARAGVARGARRDAPGPIDPDRLISGINTLYICAPAHDQRRLTPLFVSLLRRILEHVYDRVTMTGRPLDPPLLVVLDEAANIAPLADLDALAATAAGHGVQLVTIWHDLAQITARYGPRASTVVNNHRAKLFLSGISDPDTLEHASRLVGEEEVVLPSTTTGGRAAPSTTRSRTTRRLAPPDSLRRIPPGHGILIYGNLPPARLRLCPWYSDPLLADLAAGGRLPLARYDRPGDIPDHGAREDQARFRSIRPPLVE